MADTILAFDIGGTHMRAALVTHHKITRIIRIDTPKTKKDFVEALYRLGDTLQSKEVKGVGVSIAGVIKNGVVKTSPNLPLRNYNIKKVLETRYKKPTYVHNDAGCFAIAETKLGVKKKHFIVLTLGTGLGGGIVIDGKPYRGGTGLGGELGHIYVQGRDFESLWKHTRQVTKREFHREVLLKDLVRMDYPKARHIIEEAAEYFAKAIASLIAIFDPEVVVLAGGPAESGPKLITLINKNIPKYQFIPRKIPIKWSTLKEPGILGASLLVE